MKATGIRLKTKDEIMRIREAGRVSARVFESISRIDLAGMTTWELDSVIDEQIVRLGARAAFKTLRDYGFASCISINEVAVHGVPSKKRIIKRGDAVKVDIGISLNGYFSDSCRTFIVDGADQHTFDLAFCCEKALNRAVSVLLPGNRISDIGNAIEDEAESEGFSVIRNLTGHGVGFALHEPPAVPSYRNSGQDIEMRPGLVLAIEPILTSGVPALKKNDDIWEIETEDGSTAVQYEHTVAVTENGPLILTKLEAGGSVK